MPRARVLHLIFSIFCWIILILFWKFVTQIPMKHYGYQKSEVPGSKFEQNYGQHMGAYQPTKTFHRTMECQMPGSSNFSNNGNNGRFDLNFPGKLEHCSNENLFYLEKEELVLESNLIHQNCCLQDVKNFSKEHPKNNCTPIGRRTNISSREFIQIKCLNYTSCICNFNPYPLEEIQVSYQAIFQMLNAALDYLNQKIEAISKYRLLCEPWQARMNGVTNIKLINSSDVHVLYQMEFTAVKKRGKFRATIYSRVKGNYLNFLLADYMRNISVIEITRVGDYDEESSCITKVADKQFCFCKNLRYENVSKT